MPNKDVMVDFLVCGAQKNGTFALNKYLSDYANICLADKKEVHFFDVDENFSFKKVDYSKYHTCSPGFSASKITGKATLIYMYWEQTLW